MKSLLKGFRKCRRVLIASIAREIKHADEAIHTIGPILRAALLLSNSIRRDTCVFIAFKLGGVSYLLLADGARIRGLRADYYSLNGYMRKVLRNGSFGGSIITTTPRNINASKLCKELMESRIIDICAALDIDGDIREFVNAIVFFNIVTDRLEAGQRWIKKVVCRSV